MRAPASVLGPVRDAADEKVRSMLIPSRAQEGPLRAATTGRVPDALADHGLSLARRLAADADARDTYLAHPLRVTRFVLALDVNVGDISSLFLTAILHNVYEVSGASEHVLVDEGVPAAVADGIRLLTIDRTRETDPEYLTGFYGAIEAHGRALALVRTIDKLDNLLGLELLADGPVKDSYVELAERFVGPLAARLSPEVGRYFAEVVAFAKTARCDVDRLAAYEARQVAP